jgi:predicted DCC family thiol-disulfide oxidoreductase YuxK
MTSPVRLPVLVFDGECGFCTTCARFLARWVLGGRFTLVAPWQQLDLAGLGLTVDRCREAVQWVGPDGEVASGHAAIAAALAAGHRRWHPVGGLLVAPGFSWVAERIYSWIAGHRSGLPGGTAACRPDDTGSIKCLDL